MELHYTTNNRGKGKEVFCPAALLQRIPNFNSNVFLHQSISQQTYHNPFNLSYVNISDLLDAPALSRYCTAVYWVVATMTSTGYGDIHGGNSYEMGKELFLLSSLEKFIKESRVRHNETFEL